MGLVRLLCAFVALSALAAGASPPTVTVVLSFEPDGYSSAAVRAMEREAQSLLAPSNVRLDWQLRENLPGHPEFGEMVVLTMSGKCTMDAIPVIPDELGLPLGMTYASDGQILPFGKVDCDRVRQSLQKVLTGGRRDDAVLGRALGRVVAHEMVHMLSHSKTHSDFGVTRKALSSADLARDYSVISESDLAAVKAGVGRAR